MTQGKSLVSVLALCGAISCGGEVDMTTAISDEPLPLGCTAVVSTFPSEGQSHIDACTKLTFGTNPPSSGTHYPVWATWKTYDEPIPQGFVVHSLEHGGVAMQYRPKDVDPATLATIKAWAASLPADPKCGLARRVLIVPNPNLGVPFAAAAWQATLTSTCFHGPTFAKFYRDHVGKGPEDICSPGDELLAVKPGCGE